MPTARPSISALCPTRHPGWLVEATVGSLAGHVDEIVIAANSDVPADDLRAYSAVADRLVRFEFDGGSRHWPWLAEQARTDWVLIIDGDELPSQAFLDALSELAANPHVAQYSLPIHWPCGGPDHRLTDEPWRSDRRLRLLRSGPGLRFAGRHHELAHPSGPVAYRDDLPFLHLDLLLASEQERAEKCDDYERQRFGFLTAEGLPFNAAFYLPEQREEPLRFAPVDPADAARIAATLARRSGWQAPAAEVAAEGALATSELQQRRRPDGDAGDGVPPAGAVTLVESSRIVAQRGDNVVWVDVEHRGAARWSGASSPSPQVEIVASWVSPSDVPLQPAQRRAIPHDLEPGQRARCQLLLTAPAQPGPARLALALAFGDALAGAPTWSGEVDVRPGRNELLAAANAAHCDRLPLTAVEEARRAIGRIDGLLAPPGSPAPAPHPSIAAVVTGLPVGEQALDGPTLDYLAGTFGSLQPEAIIELGAGTSTVLLATLLAQRGRGHVVAVEQQPAWAQVVRGWLSARGLSGFASVVTVPVEPAADGPPGYALTDEARAALDQQPPAELVLIDGPAPDLAVSRVGALTLLAPWLAAEATVLLDDAFSDSGLSSVRHWQQTLPINDGAFLITGDGLWHGVLSVARGDGPAR